jgi:hypothetical protein
MLKDYSELEHDRLKIPINGKTYEIPELGAADGAKLQLEQDPKTRTGMTSEELRRLVLGSALDEMLTDNVPRLAISRALMAALADADRGRAAAEMIWNTGADPKAIAQLVKNSTETSTQTSTGEEPTTPSPVSTSGTKSPDPS